MSRSKTSLKPRKRPSQSRSRQTVDAIVEAAARVFAARGYHQTNTNDIAERAGVSVGSLYEYFPNKDAILVALVESHIRDAHDRLAAAFDALALAAEPPPLAEIIRRLVREVIELHAARPGLHQVLLHDTPLPPPTRTALEHAEAAVRERVRQLLATHPDARVPDPALAARIVVRATEALAHDHAAGGPDSSSSEAASAYAEEVSALLISYLTGRNR
jgi:AcrR family transcriptional regulator